tara:strand:+ start:740 stop:886 length:147 start_codon:yes stop_codon:yes gene_type:complete
MVNRKTLLEEEHSHQGQANLWMCDLENGAAKTLIIIAIVTIEPVQLIS